MKIGSLFSGIGGLELGLEWAGVGRTVWQVEIDPFCRSVLATHWPDAVRYEDVRQVGAHNLEPVDVICGGFPCQDISFAGNGAGLTGTRSGLWYEFARIIRELRPPYVVVENVAALLVRGMGDVLGTLAALGYDAEWSCLQALDVGAPHIRDRLFLVAYATGDLRGTSGNDRPAPSNGGSPAVDDPDRERCGQSPLLGQQPRRAQAVGAGQDVDWPRSTHWDTEPALDRVVDGVPVDVVTESLRALGNAVVPQCAEVVGRRLLQIAATP